LGVILLCAIRSVIAKNNLFEYGDGANTFHVFNPIQAFLHLKKKLLLTRYKTRTNMLVIILLHNDYFFKYFFLKKYIRIIFFIDFLYQNFKIIKKTLKKLI